MADSVLQEAVKHECNGFVLTSVRPGVEERAQSTKPIRYDHYSFIPLFWHVSYYIKCGQLKSLT